MDMDMEKPFKLFYIKIAISLFNHFHSPHRLSLIIRYQNIPAAKWLAGHGQAVQVVRYEEIPAERQSRDEEAVSGEKQAGDTGEEF